MSAREDCGEFERMVGPLVDGELPAPEAEAVESHLGACAKCRQLAEDFRGFDRLARRLEPPPPVSSQEWSRIWERVRREPAVVRLDLRRSALDWILPALSLAALALLGTWLVFGLLRDGVDRRQKEVIQGERDQPQAVEKKPGERG